MGATAEMPVLEHMKELRKRILISLAAVLTVAVLAFAFSEKILAIFLLPLGDIRLRAFSIMDGFMIRWRLSFCAGIAGAFPVWFLQLYRFLRPGLFERERKAIAPVLASSMVLFVFGASFGYYLLSGMVNVLRGLFPPQIEFMPSAGDYLSFVLFFLLACGIAFQLPCVLVVLVRLRLLSASTLRKQRRVAYFLLFVFAEVITPVSDPIVAPLTVMAPLLVLYEASVFVAGGIERDRLAHLP